MKKTAISGAILATTVAFAFMAQPSFAQQAPTSSSSMQQAAKVKCLGGNDCKGLSACKTSESAGPGQNSCKGQGMVYTKTAEECTARGGKAMKM